MPSHLGRFYIKIRPCISCKVFLNQFTMMLNFKIYQKSGYLWSIFITTDLLYFISLLHLFL